MNTIRIGYKKRNLHSQKIESDERKKPVLKKIDIMLLLSNKHFQIFLDRSFLFVVNILAVYVSPVRISLGLNKS
jgi:hypothetical protein